jgi:hypothetical protein
VDLHRSLVAQCLSGKIARPPNGWKIVMRVIASVHTRMPDFATGTTFPETDFRAFGVAATAFFHAVMSDEAMSDPLKRREHFNFSWEAVRYRYRSCAEANAEFKALLVNPSDMWQAGCGDEELMYQLERRIYLFFTSALSVFDSFVFCLYFVGNAIQPGDFPLVATPRKIDRKRTSAAFRAAFPQVTITGLLLRLQSDSTLTTNDSRFVNVDAVRNLIGHRLSGRRTVRGSSTIHQDGTCTETHEESWHISGSTVTLTFDEEMLERHFADITGLLATLSLAAREFVEQHQPVQVIHHR